MKKLPYACWLTALSLLLTTRFAAAQSPPAPAPPCGFDAQQRAYYAAHPGTEQDHRAWLRRVAAGVAAAPQQRGGVVPDVTVPVVVHVLYTDSATNISDSRISAALDGLNVDFRGDNADTASIIPIFKQRIGSVGFRFRLARLDPRGNCTTGITRHYSPESATGTPNVLGVAYWPPNKYLNIWVVDNISAGALAYAFGGMNCAGPDGIVVRGSSVGPNGNCNTNYCLRTLTHEVGHYFGLFHTWGLLGAPGQPANCLDDDGIADTPNTSGYLRSANGPCDVSFGTCLDAAGQRLVANVQNYMDYADCLTMFTLGQQAVMRAAVTSNACRQNLVSAANLLATGTHDGYVPVPCAPVAGFLATDTTVCVNAAVRLRDYSYNTTAAGGALTYAWAFPGGTPATATGPAPTVRYAAPGFYSITETVTNAVGSDSATRTRLLRVEGPGGGLVAPYAESFEQAASFPHLQPAPSLLNWLAYNANSTGSTSAFANWQVRSNAAAADGAAYATVHGALIPAGTISTAITPNLDLSGSGAPPVLRFSRAFRPRLDATGAASDSELRIAFSNDCGRTWSAPVVFGAAALSTQGSAAPGSFSPATAADWQDLSLPIPVPYAGSATCKVRFQFVNASIAGTRTNFFFDNLRVGGTLGTPAAGWARRGISVYPNPATEQTAVRLTLTVPTAVQLRLTDVLGREVLALPAKTYPAGTPEISLSLAGQALPAGLYVLRVGLDGEWLSSKLTIQK